MCLCVCVFHRCTPLRRMILTRSAEQIHLYPIRSLFLRGIEHFLPALLYFLGQNISSRVKYQGQQPAAFVAVRLSVIGCSSQACGRLKQQTSTTNKSTLITLRRFFHGFIQLLIQNLHCFRLCFIHAT